MIDPAPSNPHHAKAAAALLRWFANGGVDAIVQEAPRDRFAETEREAQARAKRTDPVPNAVPAAPAAPPRKPAESAAPPLATGAPDSSFPAFAAQSSGAEATEDARERAASSATLEDLRGALAAFDGCNLKLTARALVFGNGPDTADLMFVGEAPGREEDAAGEPFVGRSGRLLDRMLEAIGIERAAVRVTNTVPWRPPGNRSPTPAETEMCLPFVKRQIELVRPKVLVCLGSPAAKALLATDEGIMRLRGRWHTLPLGPQGAMIEATAMLHPAYLLRQPAQKRLAWRDLLAVKARLG